MRLSFLLVVPSLLAAQAPLAERIEALISRSAAASRAHWGILAVAVDSGAVVYQRNQESYFVPASNTKLFSTSLALMRLGPDHRVTTRILADAAPDAAGTVKGDLRIYGGGDTSLSARVYPYKKDGRAGYALQAIETFADEIVAKGVRRIDGDVVGDDTAYVWNPYGPGWSLDDATWEYGAPVSALILNDNAFTLSIKPGEAAGDRARITIDPPCEYFTILNRARTVASGRRELHVERGAGSHAVEVRGQISRGDRGSEVLLAIDDPALYAALVLREALTRRGVVVAGRPAARHRYEDSVPDLEKGPPEPPPAGVEIARRTSPPLLELLRVVDKVSQNLHAEIMLRETARVRRNIGSREAGLAELKEFLDGLGVPADGYALNDGSGLSRLNLLSPATVTRLLLGMANSPQRGNWIGLLPVGGEDGTLSSRFQGTGAAGRVRAKTGSLSHVSALSGYLERKDGSLLAFSIFVNNFQSKTAEVRNVMDAIVNTLLD